MAGDFLAKLVPFGLGALLVATVMYLLPATQRFTTALNRKPPTAPDGKTDEYATGIDKTKKTSILHDLTHMGVKNQATMIQAFKTLASGEPMDDKELLLEHAVSMLQSLPPNSGLGSTVAGGFIKMLWQDLPHPPGTLAGPEEKYRRHDGSNNSPWKPEMGKAGSPYCRSVPAMKTKGQNLPDPELVFENLLKRKGTFRPHPSGLNRLFFSFATVVIHECFQTRRTDQWINETSSYVDLSTLYGNTEKEQVRVRTMKNGLIFPDSVASERVMLMPTGVVAVLMLFSRNHNHIAQNLLSINEKGEYADWDSLDKDQQTWQDNDIFQVARNINVGFFASVVMKDYVAAILNTPRADSLWSLNLGGEIKSGASRVERGSGNVVSVEFAVLYHWHAALSHADAVWMENLLRWNLGDKFPGSVDDVTTEMFHEVLGMEVMKKLQSPAKEWTFDHYKRGPDGRFSDVDLGNIIKDCIEEPAHAFGAHGTPAALKYVDIMGQKQARDVFNVCTLNEFRKYLNLKPYESFEAWCEDEDTARAAELLYSHIDNMELYPGLQAECTKPPIAGSGVCPGQTTGRGILDDAISLVRGDRFLTYDFNGTTLSNWGFAKLSEVPQGSYGGILSRLILTGLPSEFNGTSSYAMLPFYTPEAVRGILRANKVIDQYDMDRPSSDQHIVSIHSQAGCKKVLEDRDTFRVTYQANIRNTTNGHDFLIGWDEQKRHDDRFTILHKAFFEADFEANVTKYFRETVSSLIEKSTLKYRGSQRAIDIVRDVTNPAPTMWLADRFAIPIKSMKQPRGIITLPELYDAYLEIFMYQNFNVLPVNEWKLRESSMKASTILRKIFEGHLKTQTGIQEGVVDFLAKGSAFEVKPDADRLYHALNDTKLPVGDLVADLIGLGGPIVANISHQATLLVDLFLQDDYKEYKQRIVELANRDDDAANKELEGFVLEGMRHAGVVPGLSRMAAKDTTIEDGERGPIKIKAYQTVLVATSKAAMDPAVFPSPEKLDPSRPILSYTLFGHGLHACFGTRLAVPALTAMVKEIFKLKGLRRAEGRAGQLVSFDQDIGGVQMKSYIDVNARESFGPTTMGLLYDE